MFLKTFKNGGTVVLEWFTYTSWHSSTESKLAKENARLPRKVSRHDGTALAADD